MHSRRPKRVIVLNKNATRHARAPEVTSGDFNVTARQSLTRANSEARIPTTLFASLPCVFVKVFRLKLGFKFTGARIDSGTHQLGHRNYGNTRISSHCAYFLAYDLNL